MASWVMLLVLQPVLIHKGRYAAHRFFGKLSYVIAPLIIISMFLIAKLHYHKWVAKLTHEGVFAIQSITWMQLLLFVVFYTMAVYQRKNTAAHMRFMIGTAILMTGRRWAASSMHISYRIFRYHPVYLFPCILKQGWLPLFC
jgi:hypothetical protein